MTIKELKQELDRYDDETEICVDLNFKQYPIKAVDGNDQLGVYLDIDEY